MTTYQDPSLSLPGYDFHSEVSSAESNFNGAPAYNPNFVSCTSGVCNYYISAGVPTNCNDYGETDYDVKGSLENATGIGWYQFFTREHTVFNSKASWNNSLSWANSGCSLVGDGQATATHEMGHASSLGHTSYTTAVMYRQAPINYHTLQSNDIAGLQAIYSGSQPSN